MNVVRRSALLLLWGSLLAFGAGSAFAQRFPEKPMRIIVPFPPGAFNDTLARVLAQKFQESWGQTVVVDNRPGGATLIAGEAAAKSPADGHTLYIVAFPFAVVPSLYTKMPYDTLKDFVPVAFGAQSSNILVVNPKLPIRSVGELIAAAKASPGKLSYGSTGPGSSNNLCMLQFMSMTGVNITHVPYKGSAPMNTDLLGGHIDVAFDNAPNLMPHIKAGALRALGSSSGARSTFAPDIPTVAEAGVPGYEVAVWFGVVAPAGVPQDVLTKLNTEVNRILALPDVRQNFADQGVEPVGGTREKFGDHIKAQMEKWAKVIKDAGIKPE